MVFPDHGAGVNTCFIGSEEGALFLVNRHGTYVIPLARTLNA